MTYARARAKMSLNMPMSSKFSTRSIRTCSKSRICPSGRTTRTTSRKPWTGPGTEQKPNVATTVSKLAEGSSGCCTSARNISSYWRCKVFACCRAISNIPGVKSIAVILQLSGQNSMFFPVPTPTSSTLGPHTTCHNFSRHRRKRRSISHSILS